MSDHVLTLLNNTVLSIKKHFRVGDPLSKLVRRATSAIQKYELLTISPNNLSSPSVRSLRDETMKLIEEWREEHKCFDRFIDEHGIEVESRASSLDVRFPSAPDEKKTPPLFQPHAGNYDYELISENIAHELNLKALWNGRPETFGMTELCSEDGAYAVAHKFKLPKSQQFTLDTPKGRVTWDVSEIAVKVVKVVNELDLDYDPIKTNCMRIVREMNVWSKLKHENIVPLLGIWENFKPNSYTVPVSPWMTNGTLEKYSRNDLSMLQRLSIMRDIARALDYMHNHEQGDIAHADLKPDNILVKDGRAYLCDFGLSHLHGRIEGFTSKQHGNNRWKAPEMISASVEEKMKFKPTCANDIYSFGLIFLFIVWKDLPWGAHDEAVIYDVRRDRPELSPMADSTRDEVDRNHLLLMEECWRWEPLLRITAKLLLENLLQKLIDAEELMAKVTEKGEGAAKPENVKREYDTTFYLRPPFHKPSLSN
ncbi:kinase-like domain-containing protein [Phellopilus nigrolimitatus]|nr:kinase-like domain-containing protein [Phellopilus nigrolimitatus]